MKSSDKGKGLTRRDMLGRTTVIAAAGVTGLAGGVEVHYMYTDDSEVSDNVSTNNTVGFAIMYSHRLTVRGNVSDGDRDRGLLFNFANGSEISGNEVRGRLQSRQLLERQPVV